MASGFYATSNTVPDTITFYIQSVMPTGIKNGWTLLNMPGILGHTNIIGTTNTRGSYPGYGAYNGTIDFQVDVPQTIQGIVQVFSATISPEQIIPPPTPVPIIGSYFTESGNLFVFYSRKPLENVKQGWNIVNVPRINMTMNVVMVSEQGGNLGPLQYLGIITAVPIIPKLTIRDENAYSKLMSVLGKSGTFSEVLAGKLMDLKLDVFRNSENLSRYLKSSPNLLKFFSEKTGLQPEAILADPKKIKGVLENLPELTNALGFRLRKGRNKFVDGFLNDKNMLLAIGQGPVLMPILPATDGFPTGVPVYEKAGIVDPNFVKAFVPARVTTVQPTVRQPVEDEDFKRFPVDLRELNIDVPVPHEPRELLTEKRNLGFNAGGVLAIESKGLQDEYISKVSEFTSGNHYEQYTNSVIYQDYIQFPPITSKGFIQTTNSGTCVIEIQPKNRGDLLANMFIQCSLPALPIGYSYTNQIGRAIIQQVDFMIDGVTIETIYDDWLFIRDQIFLDYDEQLGMVNQVNGGLGLAQNLSPSKPVPLIIPLEFFFCRRHSGSNKGRERLRRPFFPLCSLWAGQKIYVKFTFRPQYWFTNYTTPIDLINPVLLLEYVNLTNDERLYYRNTPLRYVVPVVKKESTVPYAAGNVTTNLTANFPVQFISWFIRNKDYEQNNPLYFDSRYLYGYATQYIQSAVNLQFPSGQAQYLDVIQTVKITINNQDILDTFANGPYTSFLQPMQHGLSVPQKNIYMYSFGLNVTEYNSGGYLNFSKVNSQTSNLTITFLPQYATSLAGYNFYLFYYGFSILEFKNGFAGVSYL